MRECWREPQNGESRARPAVDGDAVFFLTGDGRVIGRDVSTGAVRWVTPLGVATGLSGEKLVARSGVLLVPLQSATFALDVSTGRILWRYAPPVDSLSGPTAQGIQSGTTLDADDETAYLPAWGATISAVDIRTGAVRWVWAPGRAASDTAERPFRSGAEGVRASGDTVFANVWHFRNANGSRSEPWLIAIDARSGREFWRVTIPDSTTGGTLVSGAPTIVGNRVYAGTAGGYVWAYDRTTRALIWRFTPTVQYAAFGQPEVVDGVVYTSVGDERLYALDAATGAVRWSAPAGIGSRDLLISERRIYVPTTGKFGVVDRASGRVLVNMPAPGGETVHAPLTAAGRRIYVVMTTSVRCYTE